MEKFNSYTTGMDLTFWRELCYREGTLMHFNKGDVFAQCGGTVRYWGWVVRGYFKYAVTDSGGDVHIMGFAFSNGLVGDFLNTVGEASVGADIIAATATDVMACDVSLIRRLFAEQPELCLTIATGLFRQAHTLYREMHVKSPKERYIALLERCPDIVHCITLREMSSYLQITPTHLSRIRKELTFG